MRTIFIEENEEFPVYRTETAQNSTQSGRKVKFPQTIRHKKKEAVIYGKTAAYPLYRVAWQAGGKRHVKSFTVYAKAKEAAEKTVRDLDAGSSAPALSNRDADEALAARRALDAHYAATGRRLNLLETVTQFLAEDKRLGGGSISDAVKGFLTTVASVTRKRLADAVEEFIAGKQSLTQAEEGKREKLNLKYFRAVAHHLREFSATVANTDVCDIVKPHLDAYMELESIQELGGKVRNARRADLKSFFKWCVAKDYLSHNHRLHEAESLAPESTEIGEIDFYRPEELNALLTAADGPLRAMIAMNGLAGIRIGEILRMNWEDIWAAEGHITIGAAKAKTRARRLIETPAALVQWLAPYRQCTGKIWPFTECVFHVRFVELLAKVNDGASNPIPRRRNGLRHAFCTYHLALHSNEGLTAAMAGNSPTMLHKHYKGLTTKADAEKWFAVTPETQENIIPLAATAKA